MTNKALTYNDVILEALICDAESAEHKAHKVSISGHLFTLAKDASDLSDFMTKADGAEAWYKSAAGQEKAKVMLHREGMERKTDKLPAAWVQAKSNIKAGMMLGLEPGKFETESAFRAEKIAENKRRNPDTGKATITVKEMDAAVYAAILEVVQLATAHGAEASVNKGIIEGLVIAKVNAAKAVAKLTGDRMPKPKAKGTADKGLAKAVSL